MKGKRRTLPILGVAVLLFAAAGPLQAREESDRAGERGGVGYFLGGVGWVLEPGGASLVYSAGGGGHSITNRWVLGGEGHSSFGARNAGGYGFFNVGYVVAAGRFVLFYPLLGIGGGSMTRDSDASVSKCMLLNPCVAVDFLLPVGRSSGILLGVHGGYAFTVYSNTFDWSMPTVRLAIGGYGFGE